MAQNDAPNGGNRDKAAVLLAGGSSQTATAEAVGVGRSTIIRWLADPDFAQQVKEIRRHALNEATSVLAAGAAEAARRLVGLACEPHSNASVRLGACRSVLQLSHDLVTVEELEERLEMLEIRSMR